VSSLENKLSFAYIFLLLIILPVTSFGYLDPGSGSLILQGVIGAIAVGIATGKLWWYKLKSLFSSKQDSLHEESDDNRTPESDE
jgi:hypothetical protein